VLHADDRFVNQERLMKIASAIETEAYDIFSAPVWVEQLDGKRLLFKPPRILWWHHFKTIFPHQGCLIHRRIHNELGGYATNYKVAMDYDFFYRALMLKPKIKFSSEPLAIMGGAGISNSQRFLRDRLYEEHMIQRKNETNPFWRVSQYIFRGLYYIYKLRALTRFA
jgi:hypothetical protein